MRMYLGVLVLLLLITNVAAVGVSPPRIILQDLPKNFVLERSVTLSGVNPGSAVTTSLSGEGSEWVTPTLGFEFLVEDSQDIDFPFIIDIPEKAPNGAYEVSAQIIVSPKKQHTQPNSATISSGVLVSIQFTISGEEIKKYRISSVRIPNIETGSPLLVVMDIHNDGNVLVAPKSVELVVKNKFREVIASTSTEKVTLVEPYTFAGSVAAFGVELDPEFYFGDVTIHTEQGIEERTGIPFDVVERGAFKAKGELIELEAPQTVEEIAKLEGLFVNQGEVDLYSVLKGEVYKGDTLVDIFESEPRHIPIGEEKKFTHYYTVTGTGEYVVKAHVEYLEKESNSKEVSFKTLENSSFDLIYVVVGVLAFMVVILLCAVLIRRKKP